MLNVWHTQPRAYPLHTTWNHRVRVYQKISIIHNIYYIYLHKSYIQKTYTAKTSPFFSTSPHFLESFLIILGPIWLHPQRWVAKVIEGAALALSPEGGAFWKHPTKRLTLDPTLDPWIPFWDVKKKPALVDVDMSFFYVFFLKYLTVFFCGKKGSPLLVMLKAGCLYVCWDSNCSHWFFHRVLKFTRLRLFNLIRIWKPSIKKSLPSYRPSSPTLNLLERQTQAIGYG